MVFDLETNGLDSSSSVLSCTAEKYDALEGLLTGREFFHRYYFSREPENPSAIRVNGLTRIVLEEKRRGRNWPEFFRDDWDFIGFCRDAELIVAHNVEFDFSFCPFLHGKELFCTMKSHAAGKYPRLGDLARRYGLAVAEGDLHAGEYDVSLTTAIFREILRDIDAYVLAEQGEDAGRYGIPPEKIEAIWRRMGR